jgi:hypothetical protein
MPVLINEFEAIADDGGGGQGAKAGKQSKAPVTAQARLMRALARVSARQNRLRAY